MIDGTLNHSKDTTNDLLRPPGAARRNLPIPRRRQHQRLPRQLQTPTLFSDDDGPKGGSPDAPACNYLRLLADPAGRHGFIATQGGTCGCTHRLRDSRRSPTQPRRRPRYSQPHMAQTPPGMARRKRLRGSRDGAVVPGSHRNSRNRDPSARTVAGERLCRSEPARPGPGHRRCDGNAEASGTRRGPLRAGL